MVFPPQPPDLAAACQRFDYRYGHWPELRSELRQDIGSGQSKVRSLSFWLPNKGAPAAMVVIGHGTGNDRFYPLRQLIEDLMAAGFGVATGDLPGHGRWHRDSFTLSALREFWPATLATVAAQGFPAIIAIGHSLSAAMLAQHVGQQPLPAICAGAILLSPPVEVTVSLKAIAYELWYSLGESAMLREVRRYGPWGIVPALGSFKRAQFPVRVTDGQRYLDIVHEYLKSAAQLSKPPTEDAVGAADAAAPACLVLSGRQDMLAPSAAGQHYATKLAGHNMVIEPCNHFTLPFKTEAREAILSFCQSSCKERPSTQKGPSHVRP